MVGTDWGIERAGHSQSISQSANQPALAHSPRRRRHRVHLNVDFEGNLTGAFKLIGSLPRAERAVVAHHGEVGLGLVGPETDWQLRAKSKWESIRRRVEKQVTKSPREEEEEKNEETKIRSRKIETVKKTRKEDAKQKKSNKKINRAEEVK